MITIITGRSGSGKTAYCLEQIRASGAVGKKSILLVPEQYSHDAERLLCRACGNGASLYAEVLSFSRLCLRVQSETDAPSRKTLNAGGRILLMRLALQNAAPQLRIFGGDRQRAEFLESLLRTYDAFKTAQVTCAAMLRASERIGGALGDKLRDLSLLFETYEALIPAEVCDPRDRMEELVDLLEFTSFVQREVFVDGFTDFTPQERHALECFVRAGADVTVCLTCDSLSGDDALFANSRRAGVQLVQLAKTYDRTWQEITLDRDDRDRAPELQFVEQMLFSAEDAVLPGDNTAVELYRAASFAEECELAAAQAIRLVQENGYRWRDIAVAAPDWSIYADLADGIFAKYDVPVMQAAKTDILEKPVLALVIAALEILGDGWSVPSMLRYLKTNLTGITLEERDILENYLLKWNIRGARIWCRENAWQQNPSGFSDEIKEADAALLAQIDVLRRKTALPLSHLQKRMRSAGNAKKMTMALYDFLEEIRLPTLLQEKAAAFRANGRLQLADEYAQVWEILVSAMEQTADLLGEMPMDAETFAALFRLLLSQYEIGTIPVSLDRVGVGSMTRMRRRDIRCLIFLGASDGSLPGISESSGLLTDRECELLAEAGADLGEVPEIRIERAINDIYTAFTLPSRHLTVSYSAEGESGRPAFVLTRLSHLLHTQIQSVPSEIRTYAELPCFELAAAGDGELARAADAVFLARPGQRDLLLRTREASRISRGRLSALATEKLYGKRLQMSASRVDRFRSCQFSYFLQYGLRAKPRKQAAMDALEAGTFIHYLLENVSREADAAGGFAALTETRCRELCRKYVNSYIDSKLDGLQDKSARFRYLFNRLARDAEEIVLNLCKELAVSDFKPLAFELNFAPDGDLPPAEVTDGELSVEIRGKADRVDGWVHDGKLYLRVVDYKTGVKSFSLSDVWYGMGMQMLIYLFMLEKYGSARFGREIVPAGVLYMPARDETVKAARGTPPAEIERAREKGLKRNGLLLKDPDVLAAMDHGNPPRYLPIKFNKDGLTDESVASAERLGKLSGHIRDSLLEMGRRLSSGEIEADPYYRSGNSTPCLYCEYFEACHFDENTDKRRYLTNLKPAEVWKRIEEAQNGKV